MATVYKRIAIMAIVVMMVLSILPIALARPNREGMKSEIKDIFEREVAVSGETMSTASMTNTSAAAMTTTETSSAIEVKEQEQPKRHGLERALKEVEKRSEKAVENIERVQEKIKEKKEKFMKAQEKYDEKMKQFQDKKEQLAGLEKKAQCKEDNQACQEKKLALKKGVQERLVHTIELIDSSLEKLLSKVEDSQTLTEQEKQETISRIKDLEMQLTAKKEKILALGNGVSGPELKAQIKELKKLWQDVQKEQRHILTSLISHQQENVVDIYALYGTKMEAQINLLAKQGADVAKLNEILATFREKVAQLKVASESARTAWETAKSQGTPEAMKEARTVQKKFQEMSKATKVVLRELLSEFKNARKGLKVNGENDETEPTATTEPTQPTPGSTAPLTENTAVSVGGQGQAQQPTSTTAEATTNVSVSAGSSAVEPTSTAPATASTS